MKETDYDFDQCYVTCDGCGKTKTIDGTDYSDVNAELRDRGWIVRKIDNEWMDFCCMDCYKKCVGN